METTNIKATFKTRSYQRAIKAIYSCLDDKDVCRIQWREYVDDSIKTRSMCMRIWEAKSLLAILNRYSFIALSL